MQRGLSRLLMAGVPVVNADLSVDVLGPGGDRLHSIAPAALVGGGVGYLYERLVGLDYERQGYSVEYRSRLGYRDAGVDLIAKRANEIRFIQCKCVLHAISPMHVERILFAASEFVRSNLGPLENHFDLVVPFEGRAFPTRSSRGRRAENKARAAFLRYNGTQRRVRLHIREFPLPWHHTGAVRDDDFDQVSLHDAGPNDHDAEVDQ